MFPTWWTWRKQAPWIYLARLGKRSSWWTVTSQQAPTRVPVLRATICMYSCKLGGSAARRSAGPGTAPSTGEQGIFPGLRVSG